MKEKEILTVEKLRTFIGCEHYSDQEAEGIIISLRGLSELLLLTDPEIAVLLNNPTISTNTINIDNCL